MSVQDCPYTLWSSLLPLPLPFLSSVQAPSFYERVSGGQEQNLRLQEINILTCSSNAKRIAPPRHREASHVHPTSTSAQPASRLSIRLPILKQPAIRPDLTSVGGFLVPGLSHFVFSLPCPCGEY